MLIELPLRIPDEIARRSGTLGETRGKQLDYLSERWFIQDGRANFVKLIPLSKNLKYYQEDSQEPQNKQPGTVKKPLENIVASGFKIVDLEFPLFQLMKGCQNCQKKISLCDIEKDTKRGLAYILYIKCNECKSLVRIYISRYHTNAEVKSDQSDEGRHNVFNINSLCAAGNCLCQVFWAFRNTAVPLRQLNLAVKSWADFTVKFIEWMMYISGNSAKNWEKCNISCICSTHLSREIRHSNLQNRKCACAVLFLFFCYLSTTVA